MARGAPAAAPFVAPSTSRVQPLVFELAVVRGDAAVRRGVQRVDAAAVLLHEGARVGRRRDDIGDLAVGGAPHEHGSPVFERTHLDPEQLTGGGLQPAEGDAGFGDEARRDRRSPRTVRRRGAPPLGRVSIVRRESLVPPPEEPRPAARLIREHTPPRRGTERGSSFGGRAPCLAALSALRYLRATLTTSVVVRIAEQVSGKAGSLTTSVSAHVRRTLYAPAWRRRGSPSPSPRRTRCSRRRRTTTGTNWPRRCPRRAACTRRGASPSPPPGASP